jgi:hypothetical protein
MSIDVGGWIEVRSPEMPSWKALEGIDIDRVSGMLECLFGEGDRYHFRPIAPGRGVPDDASPEVRSVLAVPTDIGVVGWITWAEIAGIDWNEHAVTGYTRYIRTKHGHLVPDPSRQHLYREPPDEVVGRLGGWPEGADELELDGAVYRRGLVARSEVMSEDWELLFRRLQKLAGTYGPDGVRIVVWLVA